MSWKIDKRRGLPNMLSLFRNEFKKYDDTAGKNVDLTHMYHMPLATLKSRFDVKKIDHIIILLGT